MPITTASEFREVLLMDFPKDRWVPIQEIYDLVQNRIEFDNDDFLPAAPNNQEPRWKRNVRNYLQRAKSVGELAWDRHGMYMLQTGEISFTADGIRITDDQGNTVPATLSPEEFRRLQLIREEIGSLGEEWVVNYEIQKLKQNGFIDLAEKVERTSRKDVAAGYDVLSFNFDGSEKYIEVKTSALSTNRFHISSNEVEVAKRLSDSFWLYLVLEIRGNVSLIEIHNPASKLGDEIHLVPESFRATIKL